MHGFQEKNDLKTKAFSNYMQGKDLATLSRLDEERYILALKEKEIKDSKSEDLKRQRDTNTKNNNSVMLRK